MIRKLQAVAIDCADPVRLAKFYAGLLGGQVEVDAEDPDWVELRGFDGTPLAFQRVEGYRPPQWPGQESPQQMHLDFDVDDIEADEQRVLERDGAGAHRRAAPGRQLAGLRRPGGSPVLPLPPLSRVRTTELSRVEHAVRVAGAWLRRGAGSGTSGAVAVVTHPCG